MKKDIDYQKGYHDGFIDGQRKAMEYLTEYMKKETSHSIIIENFDGEIINNLKEQQND